MKVSVFFRRWPLLKGIPFFLAMVMVASVLAVFLKGSRPELLRPIGALAAISALAAGLIIARQIWG